MKRTLAGIGLAVAGLVTVYELTWIGRSNVAWVIVALGVAICLVALALLLPEEK